MKRYYLSTKANHDEFFLDDGDFLARRKYLDKENIFEQVKEIVKRDRKSDLILVCENFPDKLYHKINNFFWETDVDVSLETITNLR